MSEWDSMEDKRLRMILLLRRGLHVLCGAGIAMLRYGRAQVFPELLCLLAIISACQRTRPLTLEPPLQQLVVPLSGEVTMAHPTPSPTSPQLPSDFGKLVYVLEGDLWMVTSELPEPIQVTHAGRIRAPRWSPSGQRVAYLRDFQLRVLDTVTGADWPVASPVSTFSWSPMDDRLAFVFGSGVLRLVLLDVEQGQRTLLVPRERDTPGQIGHLAWRPDGTEIAYEWRRRFRDHGLWCVPSAGGKPQKLHSSGLPQTGEAVLAGWTSDSAYLLFWQGPEPSMSLYADGAPLFALSALGDTPTLLASEVLLHRDFVAPHPITPTTFAVVAGGGRGTWSHKQIQVLDLLDDVGQPITPGSVAATSPAWSPDGQALLYVAMPDRGDLVGGDTARQGMRARKIWLWEGRDGIARQITDDAQYRDESPRWSRDGRYVLFARMDDQGVASLWLLDLSDRRSWPVVDRLGPIPGPAEGWFGFYGHVDWGAVFDWWQAAGTQ